MTVVRFRLDIAKLVFQAHGVDGHGKLELKKTPQSSAPALWMASSPDRKDEHPQRHLQDFKGVIHADGFAGYDKLYNDTRVKAACWAHVRRKVYDIGQSYPSPIAGEAIRRIGALYAIEAQIRGQPAEQRCEIRMAETQPLLDDMHRWLTSLLLMQPV